AKKLEAKKNDKKRKINDIINEMNEQKLDNTLNLITKLPESSKEQINLISSVQQLSGKENKSTYQELQISNTKLKIDCRKLHRQNQTLIRKTQSLGVQNMHFCNQNANRISKIQSLVHHTDTTFQKQLKSIFQINKREYTTNAVWLATIREPSQNWLTVSTLCTWHQDISKLHIDTQIHQAINAPSFGILVDESTRGEAKNFFLCYQLWNQKDQIPVLNVAHLEDISNCNVNTLSDIL
ncbi:9194_t:CDS:2, partial [Funneliformis mosseae]